ncbi:MAG TPA: SUMF1/EgtB/PvdO family nonheme iron enzyme [Polyangiaceae bacterium]|nr:SUMF1/EgtB/PvdO family nonheme iron enzyme [Polyangiaceae bacterium]
MTGQRALALRLALFSWALPVLGACPSASTTSTSVTVAEAGFVWPGTESDAAEHAPPRRGMVWIPPGTLVAGTPKQRTPRAADEEMTGEPIAMAGFYIDEFAYPNEAGAIPKTGMTRDEATGLCTSQGKRLCTELEWERACKGPANTMYEYGETYRAAECTMGLAGRLAPSGLRIGCKSAFGVRDLHGGPWEWTGSAWKRGGNTTLGTARGGNSEAGELTGRCANAMAVAPNTRRADLSVRCCAGDANAAEVKLTVVRGKTLEPIFSEPALVNRLALAVRAEPPPELPAGEKFRIDRVWRWHPVGNEELLVAAGCSKSSPHLACGVGVFRARASDEEPELLAMASSGWWMAVVKTDRDHDLWVYGGNQVGSFRRRVAYVWGRIVMGDPERATPHGAEE